MIRGKKTAFKHIVKATDFVLDKKPNKPTKSKRGFVHSDKDVAAYQNLVRNGSMSVMRSAATSFLAQVSEDAQRRTHVINDEDLYLPSEGSSCSQSVVSSCDKLSTDDDL